MHLTNGLRDVIRIFLRIKHAHRNDNEAMDECFRLWKIHGAVFRRGPFGEFCKWR